MKYILFSYILTSVAIAADVNVFAKEEMEWVARLGLGSNWTTIANFSVSKAGQNCPSPWLKVKENGTTMCRRSSGNPGCSSVSYTHNKMKYSKVVGLVRGYQKGITESFYASKYSNYGINDPYVDGVSITIGHPRRHVWTYASGYSSDLGSGLYNCPCSVIRGPEAPPYVGEHYYCSSGSSSNPLTTTYYTDDPLWQGTGCDNTEDNCCADVGLPWFYREFPTPQDDDFEVRICYNQPYSNKAVLVDTIVLLIQ